MGRWGWGALGWPRTEQEEEEEEEGPRDGFVPRELCRLCLAALELREVLLPVPQPWIRGWDELAWSRCSWKGSLEQPWPRAGVPHRDFTAPRLIKAQNRGHSQFLPEHPLPASLGICQL